MASLFLNGGTPRYQDANIINFISGVLIATDSSKPQMMEIPWPSFGVNGRRRSYRCSPWTSDAQPPRANRAMSELVDVVSTSSDGMVNLCGVARTRRLLSWTRSFRASPGRHIRPFTL
jgi:hypothetical protein